MKRLVLLILFVLGSIFIYAQNPFAKYGYTPKIATLSKGKYCEFFDQDTIVQIGSVWFNTQSKKIVGFAEPDTIHPEYDVEPDIVSRWLSPDPLSDEFSSWSPYNYVLNSPISMVDPGGDSTIFYNAHGSILFSMTSPNNTSAITIIPDNRIEKFQHQVVESLNSGAFSNDNTEIENNLRSFGISYAPGELRAYYDINKFDDASDISKGGTWSSADGKPVINEHVAELVLTQRSDGFFMTFDLSTDMAGEPYNHTNNYGNTIHTHPNEGRITYKWVGNSAYVNKSFPFPANLSKDIKGTNWENGSGFYEIIVNQKKDVYLYNADSDIKNSNSIITISDKTYKQDVESNTKLK